MLTGAAVATAAGGFVFDMNRTHLFNPAWPAHAKFHDGWTIAMAGASGGTALWLLRRRGQPGLAAALLAQVWLTQAAAYAFPGAAGVAHDLPDPATRPLHTRVPEWLASALMLSVIAGGYALERVGGRVAARVRPRARRARVRAPGSRRSRARAGFRCGRRGGAL